MEDILNLYQQPYDANNPLICFDERPCHLISDVLEPLPMKEGQPKREDYHYQRNGMCNVFIALQPHTGQRLVAVYQQKTGKEYADFFKQISEWYPDTETITVVQDNLSTHSPASFYKVFGAEKAFALTQKFKMHYTPTNASWLNMQKPTHDFVLAAEIELSAYQSNALIGGFQIWKLWRKKQKLGLCIVIKRESKSNGNSLMTKQEKSLTDSILR